MSIASYVAAHLRRPSGLFGRHVVARVLNRGRQVTVQTQPGVQPRQAVLARVRDGLALDSFLRSQFYKIHNREKVCNDKKIEKFYKKFGHWRGLAIWCDMTERWLN